MTDIGDTTNVQSKVTRIVLADLEPALGRRRWLHFLPCRQARRRQ